MNNLDKKRAVIFDMDGTLWDSSVQVSESWNLALKDFGFENFMTKEKMQSCMGKTLDDIFDLLFYDYPTAFRRKVQEACTKAEHSYLEKNPGKLYEGLVEAIKTLRQKNYKIFIVTNAEDGYVQAFFKGCNIESLFDDFEMQGRTGLLKAENIKLIIKRNKIDEAVYIGDTQLDQSSAKEASCPFIHASYGFGSVKEDCPAAKSFFEIPFLVEKIFEKF